MVITLIIMVITMERELIMDFIIKPSISVMVIKLVLEIELNLVASEQLIMEHFTNEQLEVTNEQPEVINEQLGVTNEQPEVTNDKLGITDDKLGVINEQPKVTK